MSSLPGEVPPQHAAPPSAPPLHAPHHRARAVPAPETGSNDAPWQDGEQAGLLAASPAALSANSSRSTTGHVMLATGARPSDSCTHHEKSSGSTPSLSLSDTQSSKLSSTSSIIRELDARASQLEARVQQEEAALALQEAALALQHGRLLFTGGREVVNSRAHTVRRYKMGNGTDVSSDLSGQAPWVRIRSSREEALQMTQSKHRRERQDTLRRVLKFMANQWRMPPPSLIISVTGDARDLQLRPEQRKKFTRDLVNASLRTTAWIITGGTALGIMKAMGDAFAQYHATTPCIAIASWGAIRYHHFLLQPRCSSSWPRRRQNVNSPVEVPCTLVRYLSESHDALIGSKWAEMQRSAKSNRVDAHKKGVPYSEMGYQELWQHVKVNDDSRASSHLERLNEDDVRRWWQSRRVIEHFEMELARVIDLYKQQLEISFKRRLASSNRDTRGEAMYTQEPETSTDGTKEISAKEVSQLLDKVLAGTSPCKDGEATYNDYEQRYCREIETKCSYMSQLDFVSWWMKGLSCWACVRDDGHLKEAGIHLFEPEHESWAQCLWRSCVAVRVPAECSTKQLVKGQPFSALDCNHSHYLLVDDDTVGMYGGEIAFRSELEDLVSMLTNEMSFRDGRQSNRSTWQIKHLERQSIDAFRERLNAFINRSSTDALPGSLRATEIFDGEEKQGVDFEHFKKIVAEHIDPADLFEKMHFQENGPYNGQILRANIKSEPLRNLLDRGTSDTNYKTFRHLYTQQRDDPIEFHRTDNAELKIIFEHIQNFGENTLLAKQTDELFRTQSASLSLSTTDLEELTAPVRGRINARAVSRFRDSRLPRIKRHVPVVLFVYGGGIGTLDTILGAVKRGHSIIVYSRSGRIADAIQTWKEVSESFFEEAEAQHEMLQWRRFSARVLEKPLANRPLSEQDRFEKLRQELGRIEDWSNIGPRLMQRAKDKSGRPEIAWSELAKQMDRICKHPQLYFFGLDPNPESMISFATRSRSQSAFPATSTPTKQVSLLELMVQTLVASPYIKAKAKIPLAIKYRDGQAVKRILYQHIPHDSIRSSSSWEKMKEVMEDSRPLIYAAMMDEVDPMRHLLEAGWNINELDRLILCEMRIDDLYTKQKKEHNVSLPPNDRNVTLWKLYGPENCRPMKQKKLHRQHKILNQKICCKSWQDQGVTKEKVRAWLGLDDALLRTMKLQPSKPSPLPTQDSQSKCSDVELVLVKLPPPASGAAISGAWNNRGHYVSLRVGMRLLSFCQENQTTVFDSGKACQSADTALAQIEVALQDGHDVTLQWAYDRTSRQRSSDGSRPLLNSELGARANEQAEIRRAQGKCLISDDDVVSTTLHMNEGLQSKYNQEMLFRQHNSIKFWRRWFKASGALRKDRMEQAFGPWLKQTDDLDVLKQNRESFVSYLATKKDFPNDLKLLFKKEKPGSTASDAEEEFDKSGSTASDTEKNNAEKEFDKWFDDFGYMYANLIHSPLSDSHRIWWAIVTRRYRVAELLWEQSSRPMLAAHVASYTYRGMPSAVLHEDDKNHYADVFDIHAHYLLQKFEKSSPASAFAAANSQLIDRNELQFLYFQQYLCFVGVETPRDHSGGNVNSALHNLKAGLKRFSSLASPDYQAVRISRSSASTVDGVYIWDGSATSNGKALYKKLGDSDIELKWDWCEKINSNAWSVVRGSEGTGVFCEQHALHNDFPSTDGWIDKAGNTHKIRVEFINFPDQGKVYYSCLSPAQRRENDGLRAGLCLMGFCDQEVTRIDLAVRARCKRVMKNDSVDQFMIKLWHGSSPEGYQVIAYCPRTKCVLHAVAWFLFLTLTVAVLIVGAWSREQHHVKTIPWLEPIFWTWIFFYALEEVVEYTQVGKVVLYMRGSANRFDSVIIFIFAIAAALRLAQADSLWSGTSFTGPEHTLTGRPGKVSLDNAAHLCLAMNIVLMWFRLLYMLSALIDRFMILLIVMRRILITDIVPFLLFTTSIIGAFEFASYYFYSTLGVEFWFGDFLFHFLEIGLMSGMDPTEKPHGHYEIAEWDNPSYDWRALVMLFKAAYSILAVVLLLNLLIAQMSNTFTLVYADARAESRLLFAELVKEFTSKNLIPPPLTMLQRGWRLVKRTHVQNQVHSLTWGKHMDPTQKFQLRFHVEMAMQAYLQARQSLDNTVLDEHGNPVDT